MGPPRLRPARASPGERCPRRSPVALFAHTRESESKSESKVTWFQGNPAGVFEGNTDTEDDPVGARARARNARSFDGRGIDARGWTERERERALSRRSRASDARVD